MSFYTAAKPLSAFPHLETREPDQWLHTIKSLFSSSKSDISPTKHFNAFVNVTKLGNATLAGMGSRAKFSHLYTPGSDGLLVNLLLSGRIAVKFKNHDLYYRPNGLQLVNTKDEPMHIFAEDVLSVHASFQLDTIKEFIYSVYKDDRIDSHIKNASKNILFNSYFSRVLRETIQSIDAAPDIVNQPMIASQYEQLLMLSLLVSTDRSYPDTCKDKPSTRSVRLVEEYIEANIDQPVRLEDLAAVTGRSVRTIQQSFKKYRGYSPSGFLRECRLRKARTMLQECSPDTSIASVALACGFASHGHFSFCYRKRFGESPQHTQSKGIA
jgi:AraC-like DNA-binding protein